MLETHPDVDAMGEKGSALILGRREIGQSTRVRRGGHRGRSQTIAWRWSGVTFDTQKPTSQYGGLISHSLISDLLTFQPLSRGVAKRSPGDIGAAVSHGSHPNACNFLTGPVRAMTEDHWRRKCVAGSLSYLSKEPQGT